MRDTELQTAARYYLISFNIAPNLTGYKYLECALQMAYKDPGLLDGITKRLYADVAKAFETTPNNVERSIRYIIKKALKGKKSDETEYFFRRYFSDGRITNSRFIYTFITYIDDFI